MGFWVELLIFLTQNSQNYMNLSPLCANTLRVIAKNEAI